MTKEEIIIGASALREQYPEFRWGQSVFNWVENNLGVAREVQFLDGVDCFYNDSQVDAFIECVLKRLSNE